MTLDRDDEYDPTSGDIPLLPIDEYTRSTNNSNIWLTKKNDRGIHRPFLELDKQDDVVEAEYANCMMIIAGGKVTITKNGIQS
jgi:hypothetical protein